jgi:START domain
MKLRFFAFLIVWMPTVTVARAQDNWELRRNENGIVIYSQRHDNIVRLRLLTEFNATSEGLEAQLQNINNYVNWVYGNKRSGIIKKINNNDIIYFTEAHLPWPIQDRDLVVELTIKPATGTEPLTITAKSIEGVLPPKKHFIRVPYSLAIWHVTPIPGNKIKIDYTFSLDPGGSIPGWLVNMTIAKGPYESFLKLGNILKSGK